MDGAVYGGAGPSGAGDAVYHLGAFSGGGLHSGDVGAGTAAELSVDGEGAAGVPASDAATAGAAGEKGLKSGAAVSSFRLQPTGACAGTSHPAANAASAAASSPPHSPMRPPARCTNCFIYNKPLLCSGRSAAGTLSAYK